MQKVKALSKKVLLSYRHIPDKKQYVEFFTAVLSIPVLITVILLNISNLSSIKNNKPNPAPTTIPAPQKIYITEPGSQTKTIIIATPQPNDNPVSQAPCKPDIGPISIVSPAEGQTEADNPVDIDISYQTGVYCSVVWSYRINGGNWSSYDNNSVALYNLPRGQITFDLRVQSVVSAQTTSLTRHFTYNGNGGIIATPTVATPTTASSSAN